MFRTTIVRRLTAVIALLAILCLAAPAVAATPGSRPVKTPVAAHASFFDQLVSWLASLGFGPAPTTRPQAGSIEKSTTFAGSGLTSAITGPIVDTPDASYGLDPNGHS